MVVFRIVVLLRQRRQFLIVLLVLERLVLLFLIVVLFSSFGDLFVGFILLTIAACEARLGLALLVRLVRYFGRDNLKNITIRKW